MIVVELSLEEKIHETQQIILKTKLEHGNKHHVHSKIPLKNNSDTESFFDLTSSMVEENIIKKKNKNNMRNKVTFQQNKNLYINPSLSIAISASDSENLRKLRMDM
jgi:hypothetical protein